MTLQETPPAGRRAAAPAPRALPPVDPALRVRRERAYAACATLFSVVLVLTNVVGVKLFALFPDGRPAWMPGEGPLTLTSGIITYPITFLLTDLVSEIWGRRKADYLVLLGFVMSLVMVVIVQGAKVLPPSPFWAMPEQGAPDSAAMQHAFAVTFFSPQVLVLASMTAYVVAQLLDVRLYHFWWRLTRGRHLWLRNNGSTLISQLVDTIIVNGIFLRFALDLDWGTIGEVILAVYLCKAVLALVDTPFIYAARLWMQHFLALPREKEPIRAPLADD